jgi:hypothetical protein
LEINRKKERINRNCSCFFRNDNFSMQMTQIYQDFRRLPLNPLKGTSQYIIRLFRASLRVVRLQITNQAQMTKNFCRSRHCEPPTVSNKFVMSCQGVWQSLCLMLRRLWMPPLASLVHVKTCQRVVRHDGNKLIQCTIITFVIGRDEVQREHRNCKLR